ncbi:MAG: 23S rRNA (uracil(1939)-C(5))-methyltransferase RlmD [Chloroflexi bacterium]|nr:23S rRNA (uracil(1939)-C(5))-methyltransferase RlmD [Chloroflexota bacterium]
MTPRRQHKPGIADALPIDRGDRFELRLADYGPEGEIPAEHEGVPVSVAGGLPGERVVAEIVKKYHDRLACRVVEVLEASPHRVAAPCPYYGPCTGCQMQHTAYDWQLEYKRRRVMDAFSAAPGLAGVEIRPTLASPKQLKYRNHARFTIGRDGVIGFVNRHTHGPLRIDECLLMSPLINELLSLTQGRLKGMTQMSVRVGENTGERMVQPRLADPSIPVKSGQKHYAEELEGRRFRVGGSSFFQVNTQAIAQVVDIVRDALRLGGSEVVVDAYAGVGVFAVMLAASAREVIGIEDSVSAVEDAKANAEGLRNVRFVAGRTEAVLPSLAGADAVVMDPPRAGCHPDAIAALRKLAPGRVAMVSCDPGTLARDLGLLCAGGRYLVDWVQPVDMFPQTYHVECVAAVRRAPRDQLEVVE